MAEVLPSELANSVMAKLYDVLTGGDEQVPASEDNFFSWCTPGIPVEASDFDFLSQGLTGVVRAERAEDVAGDAPPQPLPPAELERLRAQDVARLYQQAENLARLVDFIPDVAKSAEDGSARLAVLSNEGTLSDVYREALRMSQVARSDLDDATKAEIERLRSLLTVKTKKTNLVTNVESEVTEPSELVHLYNSKMSAYIDAVLEYNNARIGALSGDNSASQHYWAMNANVLRRKVKAAESDWISSGYRSEYNDIANFIEQVSDRDLTLLKQEYRDELEKARLTGLVSGMDFFTTSLIPGNFATSTGWTKFTFHSSDFQSRSGSNYQNKKWKVDGGASYFGIFGGRGGATKERNTKEYTGTINTDSFDLEFEIAQVPIVRPWFKPSFLTSKSWRYDANNQELKEQKLSDGGSPPRGNMPAYPTSVIFVRKLKLGLAHSESFRSYVSEVTKSQQGGGGYFSFGPLFLGGSGQNMSGSGSETREYGVKETGQGIEVAGMQIAGFNCHVLPESPDPSPSITAWV